MQVKDRLGKAAGAFAAGFVDARLLMILLETVNRCDRQELFLYFLPVFR